MDPHSQLKIAMLLLSAGAVCLAAGGRTACAAGKLVVDAGDHDRARVPMSAALPAGASAAKMSADGKDLPCQVADGKLWWILDELPAGASRTYSVEVGAKPSADAVADAVALARLSDRISITIDGKPFTSYVFAPGRHGTHLLRRPYFFPVYGPGQATMTRPFPMVHENLPPNVNTDHPHHTSIYVAHGAVNGVDNWMINADAGFIIHKGFDRVAGGAVMGTFRQTLDWTDAAKKPVMAETRTVRVYRLPDTHRMLDLEITLRAAYGKVLLGDTKEGGLCSVRMRPEFRAKGGNDGRLVNARGQTGDAAWGKRAAWVDCSGLVDGRRLGLAIFDGPGNLRHPTTWHARTYGLLTANPFGLSHFTRGKERGDCTLEAGSERTWRYRVYFHEGDEAAAKVAARFTDYAHPPAATWK